MLNILTKKAELLERLNVLEAKMVLEMKANETLNTLNDVGRFEANCNDLLRYDLASQIETVKVQIALIEELENSYNTIVKLVCAL